MLRWLGIGSLVALSACGGGGGTSPTLEVRVVIDGDVSTATSVRAGSTLELGVASGARIALESSEAADVAVERNGAAMEAERSSDREQVFRLNSPAGTQARATVASRADPTAVATVRLRVAPQRFSNRLRVVGESVTYAMSSLREDGSWGVVPDRTHLVDSVAADGSHVVYYRRDERGGYEYDVFDRDGNRTLYAWKIVNDDGNDDSESVSFFPAELLREFPLFVGKSWATSWEDEVLGGPRTARNEVLAYESVTVPAGSFATLHTRSVYGAITLDCWWSVELQIDVKCVHVEKAPGSSGVGNVIRSEAKTIVR